MSCSKQTYVNKKQSVSSKPTPHRHEDYHCTILWLCSITKGSSKTLSYTNKAKLSVLWADNTNGIFKLRFEGYIHQTKKSQKKGYKDGMCKGP